MRVPKAQLNVAPVVVGDSINRTAPINSRGRIRTCDLRIISPASFQLLHPAIFRPATPPGGQAARRVARPLLQAFRAPRLRLRVAIPRFPSHRSFATLRSSLPLNLRFDPVCGLEHRPPVGGIYLAEPGTPAKFLDRGPAIPMLEGIQIVLNAESHRISPSASPSGIEHDGTRRTCVAPSHPFHTASGKTPAHEAHRRSLIACRQLVEHDVAYDVDRRVALHVRLEPHRAIVSAVLPSHPIHEISTNVVGGRNRECAHAISRRSRSRGRPKRPESGR